MQPCDDNCLSKEDIARWHAIDATELLLHHAFLAMLGLAMAGAVGAWMLGHWPLTIVCWLIAGHLGHNKSILFHETAHGTLHPSRRVNELLGIFYGSLFLVPLTVYRYAHREHHFHLARPCDPELWPFTVPGISRPLRILAAASELCLALVYVPILFVRAIVVGRRDISRSQWKRIAAEYAICAAVWTTKLTVVMVLGWWEWFTVGYLVPLLVAANLQTLNKYVEHLGLFGDTALTSTRTVADHRRLGNAFSLTLLHVNYHGTHHRYPKIPYYHLPAATEYVYRRGEAATPIYPSYAAALWETLRSLGNPRVGQQWLTRPQQASIPLPTTTQLT
jgi:fatty acid desaturase